MKALLLLCIVCLSVVSAAEVDEMVDREELPAGFSNANELAQVLANEPASASENRFQQTNAGDVITFREAPATASTYGSSGEPTDDDDAEFDAQIAQVEQDIKKVREQIRESQECARRLTEQQSELRSLQEQREHLEKEKERHQLQMKLDRQMRDLAEINRMSRALRNKFSELKRTQQLIKTKLTGTRTSLNQLDAEPELSVDDLNKAPQNIANEMDAMQAAQQAMLAKSHQMNADQVKMAVHSANQAHEAAAREKFDA